MVLNQGSCDCPDALKKILAKLLEKGNTTKVSILVCSNALKKPRMRYTIYKK
ncbi:hypothetical protein MNB_SUP05-SYMBIONT-7-711 [hydrothermal vent metagenome]|uniref:Uncharacterized protein n=1 Tax=hydrothermal vent metagenome TaxID=652676 RepID=A0A1W1E3G9_9ZZZZ